MNNTSVCKNQIVVKEGPVANHEKEYIYFILSGEFAAV